MGCPSSTRTDSIPKSSFIFHIPTRVLDKLLDPAGCFLTTKPRAIGEGW